ncbi:MAG: hydantoinase B/oxoprolinase family protein [Actinomycetia bacterium]|nr:hydantoinase B/oxoprolinase family protein [Actinomycetes bacterium]
MAPESDPHPAAARIDESAYAPPAFEPFRTQEWPRAGGELERIARARERLDPITVDVVEGALESAIAEAEAGVERTARSTLIREQHDFRASVNTVDCQSVTHVSFAATADAVRAHYPLEEIHEGDVFLFNDVYDSHGTLSQLPDFSVAVPVFEAGRLLAFAQIFGHLSDVGGRVSGSLPLTSVSIFEEGLQVPPVRLYEQGELNTAVWKVVLRNTRFPDEVRADIDAFVGATRLIERRIHELVERLDADRVEAAMAELIERCARTLRDVVLPKLSDGEFLGEDFADNDNVELDHPVRLQVMVRKDPDKIILDWSGTSPQTAGPINWVTNGRYVAKWLGAFLKVFDPGMVVNEGVTDVLRCYIPPGTVLSPSYPAAISNRMPTMLRAVSAYRAALVRAFGGQSVADFNCGQLYGFHGVVDGEAFLFREVFGAGSGARPFADGTDAVGMVPNSKNLPAEFIEQRFPVVVERVGLSPDSAGPGTFRGGFGYVKDLRVLVAGSFMSMAERTGFGPWGIHGGRAGQPGGLWINPGSAKERHVRFRREVTPVSAGDLVRIVTPGGGGFGDPLERDVEAVRLDVLRRLVSPESAAEDYGVVLREVAGAAPDVAVDAAATEATRAALRGSRPPLALIDRGAYAQECRAAGRIDFDEPLLGP